VDLKCAATQGRLHELRLKWPRVLTRQAARSSHAATIDKSEHAFSAAGIYAYMPNIISDEDFEPSETTRKHNMPDKNRRRAFKC
jgi:hypothetical protein